VRLDLWQIERLKSGIEVIGYRVRARVRKGKVAPPFKVAEFDIMYDQGISREGEVLDLGVGCDVITKRESFYSHGGERLGNGRLYAKETLASNPMLTEEIERAIYSTLAEQASGNGRG
jgi:recombination protein RecA